MDKKIIKNRLTFLLCEVLCLISLILLIIKSISGTFTDVSAFGMGVDLIGIFVTTSFIHGVIFSNDENKKHNRCFVRYLRFLIFTIFFDYLTYLVNNNANTFNVVCNYIFNTLYYIFIVCMITSFVEYIKENFEYHNKVKIFLYYYGTIIIMFLLIVLFINIPTGILFKVVDGSYERGVFVYIFSGLAGIYMIVAAFLPIYKKLNITEKSSIVFCCFVPVLATLLQFIGVKFTLLTAGSIISTALIFSQIYRLNVKKSYKEISENEKMKNKLLLSQIQPHFIYNTLTTIEYLCDTDPNKASELCDKFSLYLRSNVDSFETEGIIPFEKELENIKNYLYIEKARFNERINYSFNITVTNFYVPVLSIQTLVENAVKHGISPKKEGGTILVSTTESDKNYQIVVTDDGIGFNYDEINRLDKERKHVGLKNSIKRIETLSNGFVFIDSIENRGSTITVIIPKK